MYDKVIESCQFLLKNYPEAREAKSYLDSRLDEESQERFKFGYFPGINNLKVLTDLIGEDLLCQKELLTIRDIDSWYDYGEYPTHKKSTCIVFFENFPIVMPFRDPYGKMVGMIGRTLLNDEELKIKKLPSKYKNTKNDKFFQKGHCLFGLYENKQSIIDQNMVYVVEGQLDVIKAMEKGFTNIVALGTCSMTSYQFSVISRYTDNIILLLDNDVSGEKGRKNIINRFGKLTNIQNFYIPEKYKDIDEYITKENIGSYEEMSFLVKN